MSALILAVFLVAAVAAMPIAHALLVAAMTAAATSDKVPLDLLVQQMVAQVQSFPLIAIPFFMLTGTLMMGGKLGEALVGVLSALIGRFHGGPAQVGVLSSTLFGGVSGSAVADASAIGSLLIPWHKRLGYPPAFSAATLAAAATIDILIPPSIPLILFALSSNASIAALFLAGVLPGLLMCGGFMAARWWVGRRRNFPRDTSRFDVKAFKRHLAYASPAVVLPVLILIFLRFGIATPRLALAGLAAPWAAAGCLRAMIRAQSSRARNAVSAGSPSSCRPADARSRPVDASQSLTLRALEIDAQGAYNGFTAFATAAGGVT